MRDSDVKLKKILKIATAKNKKSAMKGVQLISFLAFDLFLYKKKNESKINTYLECSIPSLEKTHEASKNENTKIYILSKFLIIKLYIATKLYLFSFMSVDILIYV